MLTEDWGWARQGVKLDFRSKEPATNFLSYGTGLSKLKLIYHYKSHYFCIKIKILFFFSGRTLFFVWHELPTSKLSQFLPHMERSLLPL